MLLLIEHRGLNVRLGLNVVVILCCPLALSCRIVFSDMEVGLMASWKSGLSLCVVGMEPNWREIFMQKPALSLSYGAGFSFLELLTGLASVQLIFWPNWRQNSFS